MTTKFLEIRDAGTLVPALALRFSGTDHWLLQRAGFGDYPYICLINLVTSECQWDPYQWRSLGRTLAIAHRQLIAEWPLYADGDVLDVEYVLGERPTPKPSERPQETT